jgi:hypothetical protein
VLLATGKTAVIPFECQKVRTCRRHAEPGRIGRPNTRDQRLHKPVECLPAQSADSKRLKALIILAAAGGDKALCRSPEPTWPGQKWRRKQRLWPTGRKEPEPGWYWQQSPSSTAFVRAPDECTPGSLCHRNKRLLEPETLHQINSLGPSRQKVVG